MASITLTAGELIHRVTIQQPVLTPDGRGGHSIAYATYATRWARVTSMGSGEFMRAKAVMPEITHQVSLRYCTDVVPEMRILFRGAVLRVQFAADTDGRRVRTLVQCEEIVGETAS